MFMKSFDVAASLLDSCDNHKIMINKNSFAVNVHIKLQNIHIKSKKDKKVL